MNLHNRDIRLDAIRGIAILLAMGWHFNVVTGVYWFDIALFPGRYVGWAGVDLFFVLSGFLVARLIFSEIQRTGYFDKKRFFIRRIYRLWPVLYVYVIAQAVLGSNPLSEFVPQTFFHVQNYFPTPFSHLWSLAVEEHFYFIAAFLIPTLMIGRSAVDRAMLLICVVLMLTLLLRIFAVSQGVPDVKVQTYTHFRMDSLSVGVLLAILYVYKRPFFDSLVSIRAINVLVLVISLVALVSLEETTYKFSFSYVAAYFAGASMIFLVLSIEVKGVISAGLFNVLAFFGLWSYSLYIWHNALGKIGRSVLSRFVFEASPALIVFVEYVVAVIGSILIARMIERPAIALRDKMFPRR
ncbi:acyltransferase [Pseudomonas sp. GX19020]|uniref:acyltransferase family protein n=1 Tax=Pseudomonas sp. GX19020 TaxID=2942277 RepID=UPI002018FEBF|nr:acyltransferase [Pseudomonas sp. GX19020]MCL4065354.1 acyltransferase [Pseudomonas sp. GX19020]